MTVAADQANTLGYNPEEASYGFTFVAFENPIDTFNTSRDIVNITVSLTIGFRIIEINITFIFTSLK